VISTKKGVPWELEHVEEFSTRSEAMIQENKIKSRGIRRYLESIGDNLARGAGGAKVGGSNPLAPTLL